MSFTQKLQKLQKLRKFQLRGSVATLAMAMLCGPQALAAQQRDTTRVSGSTRPAQADTAAHELETFRVSVTRESARSPFELPFALTTVSLTTATAERRISLSELLPGIPGVQVQDRANPSQDPRIAIRGFGARSAFGVRGVRILRDGVPLSLPDGQTPVDWLDLETIGSLDVLRGTAAALYGNAAGGVVDLHSRPAAPGPFALETRWWNGGGLQRGNVTLSGTAQDQQGKLQNLEWLGSFTRTAGNGPREWSRLDANSLFIRTRASVGGTNLELQATRYEALRAENTGALTASELALDPRLPDSLNISKGSRKAATQAQVALIADRSLGNGAGSVRATLFGATRTLDNPLPFAIVAIDRSVVGGSIHGAWRSTSTPWPIRLGAGMDAQRQVDNRLNFENCFDLAATAPLSAKCPERSERGSVRLDQREQALGLGSYMRAELELPRSLFLSAALRADMVAFDVVDNFITTGNPDDSGDRTLNATSPMLGLSWQVRPMWNVYSNLSTAFETPTVTELTNKESGEAGLNTTLKPQRTRTLELGTQAVVAQRVRVDAAVFTAVVLDELVRFDVPGMPGRQAFRNAGRTSRRGAEAGLRVAGSWYDAGAAYTWSHFRFVHYDVGSVSYAGKPIPGVPEHYLQSHLTARHGILWSTAELSAASAASAKDDASVKANGYAVWNFRTGMDLPALGNGRGGAAKLSAALSVENVFDRHYAGSLAVNATRGRYFEPGLPRRIVLSASLGWR